MKKKNEHIDKSKRVQCEIIFTNIMYPREALLKVGTWVSAKGRITKILDNGELLEQTGIIPSLSHYNKTNVSIVGNICAFDTYSDLGKPFKLTANVIEHDTYGLQLDILCISSLDKLDDKDSQYKFLSTVLSTSQIDTLYNSLENPFKEIQEENVEALTKIKGIGIKKAYNIIDKFKRGKDNANAYVALYDLGLTKKRIDSLVERFSSPDILVDIIKDNPYKLIELVSGFGWESADTLALNSGIHPLSDKRIEAYIFYFLETMGYGNLDTNYEYLNGSTWIEFMELYNIIIDKFPELHPDNEPDLLTNCIRRMLKKENEEDEKEKPKLKIVKVPTGAYDDRGREITFKKLALYRFWELECNIANELLRIQGGKLLKYENPELSIKETEMKQGFEFTDEQRQGIKTVLENQVSIITGKAGCVDADTEFFNGEKWKKISEYIKGDKVLQYNEDGTAKLVEPLAYIKQPSEWLWHFKNNGVNQCLSNNHTVVYRDSRLRNNKIYKKTMLEIKEQHEKNKHGFGGRFITDFEYNGVGIPFSEDEIRLMCAIFADGHFKRKKRDREYIQCIFTLKKERKKIRLEEILGRLGIEFTKKQYEGNKDCHYYTFYTNLKWENYEPWWYNCSKHQLEIVCSEVLHWDGTQTVEKKFTSINKQDVDFIQWAFTSCGHRSFVKEDKKTNSNCKDIYSVHIATSGHCYPSLSCDNEDTKVKIVEYKTLDGFEYCFTVPSHMLVLRRGGRIFVTGNCGKTTVVSGMLAALPDHPVELTSFTGAAASKLSEVTGTEGKTTHRLLKYVQGMGFMKNENDPLDTDIIIVDELGMYSLDLFYRLLKAVKTGTKFIMVGDPNQLPSLGLGNLLKDLIDSGVVPVARLNKIHRQSAKSGIITEALKVSDGYQLTANGSIIQETRGELQDFKINTYDEASFSQDGVLNEFKRLYFQEKVPIEDIQVIVPLRQRGGISTNYLNPIIQEMVNPDTSENEHSAVEIETGDKVEGEKYKYKLKVKDKIRINTNTYRGVFDTEGNEVQIFNGNRGNIKEIDIFTGEITIDLGFMGTVIIPERLWNIISLSYASSCHSSQGSEFSHVVIGLDYSAFKLLSRNWLYCAITRSKKYCVLCAQEKALRYAISTSAIDNKRTFLKDLLIEIKREQEEKRRKEDEDF